MRPFWFLYSLLFLVWCALLCATIFTHTSSYTDFIDWTYSLLDGSQSIEWLQKKLDHHSFVRIQDASKMALTVFALFLLLAFIYRKKLANWLSNLFAQIGDDLKALRLFFSALSKTEKTALVIVNTLLIIRGLYYILNWDIQHDEAWTFNNFINQGPLICSVSPFNNHVFYTIVASLFAWLPIDSLLAIRLPVFLAGLLTANLFFVFLKKVVANNVAWIGFLFLVSSGPFIFYSLYARSFMFMLLFLTVMLLSILGWIKRPDKSQSYHVSFIIASILGLYSNFAFLYALLALVVATGTYLFLNQRKKDIVLFFKSVLIILALTTLLYLPQWAINQFNWLNVASTDPATSNVPSLLDTFGYFFIGFRGGHFVLALIVLASLWMLIERKYSFWSGLVLFNLTLPFLVLLLQKFTPSDRIFIFLILYITLLITIIVRLVTSSINIQLNKILIIGGLIFLLNSFLSHYHHFLNWSYKWDKSAKEVSQVLIDHDVKSAYLFEYYHKPAIEYYYNQTDNEIRLFMSGKSSKDYQLFDLANNYEAIISEKGKSYPFALDSYRKVYEDDLVNLYLQN